MITSGWMDIMFFFMYTFFSLSLVPSLSTLLYSYTFVDISCATKYEACCSSGCVEQHSRPDLRQSILLAEREAMGFGGAISTSMEMSGGRDGNGDIYGDGDEDIGVDGGEKERRELMWLIWPFQASGKSSCIHQYL